jgi:hypothetical protein
MVNGAGAVQSWSRPSYTCSGFDERENGSGHSHIGRTCTEAVVRLDVSTIQFSTAAPEMHEN